MHENNKFKDGFTVAYMLEAACVCRDRHVTCTEQIYSAAVQISECYSSNRTVMCRQGFKLQTWITTNSMLIFVDRQKN